MMKKTPTTPTNKPKPFVPAPRTGPRVMRGKPLNYNAGLEHRYARSLAGLVDKMVRATESAITELFEAPVAQEYFAMDASVASQARIVTNQLMDRFAQLFSKEGPTLANGMVDNANATSSSSLHTSLRELTDTIQFSTSFITPAMQEVMAASVAENVALIKSIQQQYHTQVQGAVMRSISAGGNGLQDLVPELQKLGGISQRRARRIAQDQTKKVYNNLNFSRMQAIGVTHYEWLHSAGDKEPRPLHVSYNGKIFSFAEPPVIQYAHGSLPLVHGKPGDLINCTCKAIPVIKFNTGE